MSERGAVWRWGGVALGSYLLAFAVLSFGGASRSDWVVGIAVLLLVAASVLLQLTLSRAREQDLLSHRTHILVPAGIVFAGFAAVGVWWLGTELGFLTGGVGLGGVCAMYLGAGQLLAEVRAHDERPLRHGLIVAGVCALLFIGGLVLLLTVWEAGKWFVLAGFLFAPVGLTLVSEGVLRRPPPWTSPAALACPLLVLFAAWWLGHGLDLGFSLTMAVVVAGLVLVGAIASSTQADVLLAVTVVALFWAATPSGVAFDKSTAPGPGPTLIVLGDSYISGEGASEFFEDTNNAGVNECRRSPHAYPYLIVDDGRARWLGDLAFLACSGAETPDVIARAQWRGEPVDDTRRKGKSQLAQLRDLMDGGTDPGLVIVSIGGNDVGFSKIATACLAPGSCVELGKLWLNRLRSVAAAIDDTYEAIRQAVGDEVPVIAVPYPVPIRARPCGYSQLSLREHRFLHGFVEQLDGAIQQSARDAGFYYLSRMVGVLERRKLRICDAPEDDVGVNFIRVKSVNGVRDQMLEPNTWLHNSLHPNDTGHKAMAKVLAAWIRDHPNPSAKPDPLDTPAPFVPATLDNLLGTDAGTYCLKRSSARPRYCDRKDASWALTKAAGVLLEATPALLLLLAGWWLWWLPVLKWTRKRIHKLAEGAGRRLFGPAGTPGERGP